MERNVGKGRDEGNERARRREDERWAREYGNGMLEILQR